MRLAKYRLAKGRRLLQANEERSNASRSQVGDRRRRNLGKYFTRFRASPLG
jgi:hypothetical protein